MAGPLFPEPGPATIYVSGVVAINVADPNPPGFASPGAQGPVVLHELAPRPWPRATSRPRAS